MTSEDVQSVYDGLVRSGYGILVRDTWGQKRVSERQDLFPRLNTLVTTGEEFDRLAAEALPELLERATGQTKRFLRETGHWAEDIAHEKLALRWGYELLERFLVCGRTEVPCRPFFLLESLIAKYFSRPEPLSYHEDLLSPLGRFLDGLASRAVVSRDALVALFYHLYGFGQTQVVKALGLGPAESQRVYKNFERWRRTGWERTITEIGLTDLELRQLENRRARYPEQLNADVDRLNHAVQAHYRKSEPEHYPCLTRRQWTELYDGGYGIHYRLWHLALCRDCLVTVSHLQQNGLNSTIVPQFDLRFRPLPKGPGLSFVFTHRGSGNGTGRPTQRVPATSS